MRANDVLRMTDTRRLSPQTTSSSGYHSDLSSTNQSPQSIHDNIPMTIEQSTLQIEKKVNKNFLRISTFFRKQYQKAKLKLISSKQSSSSIKTCSKSTSTTALSSSSENNNPIKSQKPSSSTSKHSSFIEPIYSIYVQPLYDNQIKTPLKNSTSSHRSISCSKANNNQYRRLVTQSNYDNISTEYLSNNSKKYPHHHYVKPIFSQSYYPYKYLSKHYDYNQTTYIPLSDFISSTNSAFKPIKTSQENLCHISEQITSSDDPCDLEVAQYFHQTPQWSNPNYFDIYTNQMSIVLPRKNRIATLC